MSIIQTTERFAATYSALRDAKVAGRTQGECLMEPRVVTVNGVWMVDAAVMMLHQRYQASDMKYSGTST